MDSDRNERRLSAILIADVVGYSRLMADDEDATVRTLSRHRQEIELQVQQHRGQVEFEGGDRLLAEFPSALHAVRCGIEIQRVLRTLNAPLAPGRRMELRVGIHLGDVRVEEGHRFGTGVNVAARLEPLAKPGGLCISKTVLDQLQGNLELAYEDLGEQRVKNIPNPVHAFRVNLGESEVARARPPPEQAAARGRYVAIAAGLLLVALVGAWLLSLPATVPVSSAPALIRSLAVLPLENLSGDPEQEYFADGMTDALIGDLAKIGSLRVISRTSVMQYKRVRKPLPEIARELNVEGIIEGTVIREGDRVRITVQLIDARSDEHVWADRYDRDVRSILALQSDVARAVAEQIQVELTPQEVARLSRTRSVVPAAHEAFLKGLHHRTGLRKEGAANAVEAFEAAVAADPSYGPAWEALALSHVGDAIVGFELPLEARQAAIARAREAARKALALDDSLAGAHAALGFVNWSEWDWENAGVELQRAVQLGGSDSMSLRLYSIYLYAQGRHEDAIEFAERARSLSPLDLATHDILAQSLYYAGRNDLALDELRAILEIDPSYINAYLTLYRVYHALGRDEESQRAHLKFWSHTPDRWVHDALEKGYAAGGWQGAMRAECEAQAERAKTAYINPVIIGVNCIAGGRTDLAFEWLERGYRDREFLMVLVKVTPWVDPLRSDPRFQDLMRRVGFPES